MRHWCALGLRVRTRRVLYLLGGVGMTLFVTLGLQAQEAPSMGPAAAGAVQTRALDQTQPADKTQGGLAGPPVDAGGVGATDLPGAGADYDKAMFQKPISRDELAFLGQYSGAKSGDLYRDKQFRKLLKQILPDCMFHYGTDKPLDQSMDEVLDRSPDPVLLHDNRYLMLSGSRGPYLAGRGFLWVDLQDGVALGGFFFHPTNGEPTPTLSVFSRQVKEKAIGMSQLPTAFAEDLRVWTEAERVPPLTTRYFITGSNRRILLEHDEDYCVPRDGTSAPVADVCQQMNADAADLDMDTAYYLKQVNYATNATAWMIHGPELTAWIGVRAGMCGGVLDPLGCRIRVTHEHIHTVTGRPAPPPRPRPISRPR